MLLQLLLLRKVVEAVPLVEVVGDEYGDDEYDDAGEVVVASFVAIVAVVVATPCPLKGTSHSHSC